MSCSAASFAPLGGEGRAAWIEQRTEKIDLPKPPALEPGKDGVLTYTVTLITPADLGDAWPGPGDRLRALAARPCRGKSSPPARAAPSPSADGTRLAARAAAAQAARPGRQRLVSRGES